VARVDVGLLSADWSIIHVRIGLRARGCGAAAAPLTRAKPLFFEAITFRAKKLNFFRQKPAAKNEKICIFVFIKRKNGIYDSI